MNRQIGQEKNGPAENVANTNVKSFALHHLNTYYILTFWSTNVNDNLHQMQLSLVTPILCTYKVFIRY